MLTNEELAKVRVGVGLVVRKWSRKGMQSKKCAGQSAKYTWFDVVEHREQSTGLGGWVHSSVRCMQGFDWQIQGLGFGLGVGCFQQKGWEQTGVGGTALGACEGQTGWRDRDLQQVGVSEWG